MPNIYLSQEKIVQVFSALEGLLDGFCADKKINSTEVRALSNWLNLHSYLEKRAPFNELIKVVKSAIKDNILTEDEILDIRYVCSKVMRAHGSSDLGQLRGLASGISADNEINDLELKALQSWIQSHQDLKGLWPFDEIETLAIKYSKAKEMSNDEQQIILHFFKDLCALNNNRSLSNPFKGRFKEIQGIYSTTPVIEITEKIFCFTGESKKYSRTEASDTIFEFGGYFKKDISSLVDYLVVCNEGSPMWVYSTYGRKLEVAVDMRKDGHRIQIIREEDLWDHIEDLAS